MSQLVGAINNIADAIYERNAMETDKYESYINGLSWSIDRLKKQISDQMAAAQKKYDFLVKTSKAKNDASAKTIEIQKKNNDELAKQLKVEKRKNDELTKQLKKKECVICMDNDADYAITPCGHMCICSECGPKINNCPICRKKVDFVLKIYT